MTCLAGRRRAAFRYLALLVAFTMLFGLPLVASMSARQNAGTAKPAVASAATAPKWDAVSVKPCPFSGAGRGGSTIVSTDRLTVNCQPVGGLIATAYLIYEDGRKHAFYASGTNGTLLVGGPPWLRADHYTINAVALRPANAGLMQGPMMQAILEERFRLRVHRETRAMPVYNLVVAKRGTKLTRFEGGCRPLDMDGDGFVPPLAPGEKPCESFASFDGPVLRMDAVGSTVEDFARGFLNGTFLDRRVVDRTGLKGRFDFHLQFSPAVPGVSPSAFSEPAGPSVFTALEEQLGLRLESAKGKGEYLVIDRIERPTGD